MGVRIFTSTDLMMTVHCAIFGCVLWVYVGSKAALVKLLAMETMNCRGREIVQD